MSENEVALPKPYDSVAVGALLKDLESRDSMVRDRAWRSLAEYGNNVTNDLIKVLSSRNHNARLAAAKALRFIADESSSEALVNALEDENLMFAGLPAKP